MLGLDVTGEDAAERLGCVNLLGGERTGNGVQHRPARGRKRDQVSRQEGIGGP